MFVLCMCQCCVYVKKKNQLQPCVWEVRGNAWGEHLSKNACCIGSSLWSWHQFHSETRVKCPIEEVVSQRFVVVFPRGEFSVLLSVDKSAFVLQHPYLSKYWEVRP